MQVSRWFLIATMFCLVAPNWAASLIGIGHLPDGNRSQASAISADGSTVIGMATDSEFIEGQAIRWTRAGGIAALGDLPGGAKLSVAKGVSADGKVIVGFGNSVNTANGQEAFIWTAQEGFRRLAPILPSGTIRSFANSVSADGEAVVGSIDRPVPEAFRWTRTEGLVLMGHLPEGLPSSEATGVSANGAVIVGYEKRSIGAEVFRWTSETGMVGLGQLPGAEWAHSIATGVSADGSVVVGFGRSTTTFEAFRWTGANGMKGLGILSEGYPGSYAFAVSGDGRTVGGWTGRDRGEAEFTTAFIWTEADGMRTLWNILVSQGVNPLADGWANLRSVSGLSGDGRYAVGTGTRNGREEGFIAEIGLQLSYARVNGGIELRWPAGFRLERRTTLNGGSWEPMVAGSPFHRDFGADQEFFRLVAEP